MCFIADPGEVANHMEMCAKLLRKVGKPTKCIDDRTPQQRGEYEQLVKEIEWITLELDGVTIEQRSYTEHGLHVKIVCDQDALIHSFE